MMRRIGLAALLSALAFLGCTTSQTPPPAPAKSTEFKNLQVLPQTISRDQLVATMKGFSRSLGVRCDECHTARVDDPEKLDFPSDAKPQKNIARTMLRMVMNINGNYISKVPVAAGEQPAHVVCWTCHRGHTRPETPPPPPPEQGR